MVELDEHGVKKETPEERKKRIQPLIDLRMKKREEWDAYWKLMDIETQGSVMGRVRYYFWRGFDIPVTFWREKVVEPLRDKYGHWPYYHHRFKRVPTVDECHVNDLVCYHEAQMQFRLDKQVDGKILDVLRARRDDCLTLNHENTQKCMHNIEDYEEAELNWYIKYGELGMHGDVLTCYMKQKHRMIWERRNPEIMAAREEAYKEHKRLLNLGIYDHWFWKRSPLFMYKEYLESQYRFQNVRPYTVGRIGDVEHVSGDPEYYRKLEQDEGKTKVASAFDVM